MYSCEECTCVFKKLGSLNAHVSRMHSDDGGTAEVGIVRCSFLMTFPKVPFTSML